MLHACTHSLPPSELIFMSETLTFPRHLLTFVNTCKQRGGSTSRGQKMKGESSWSNVNKLWPSVVVATALSAKVR